MRPTPDRWTLPVILIAQFVTPMSIAGTAIALPRISDDLGTQPTALQWIVNGFNIAFAVSVLAWGTVSDRIGYRLTFTVGAGLFAGGSLVSALSPSLLLLDAARPVAGVGAAAVLTGASSLLSKTYDGPARDRAFALFGTINGLGLAFGPTISGFLVAGVGWRGVFAVHGIILAAVALCARILPAPTTHTTPTTGNARRPPLLDLSLLRNREFLAMCFVPVAGSIGFVTLLTYLPSALSGIRATGPGASGLLMLAMTIPVVVAPTAVARLVNRYARITVGAVVYASLLALILGNLGLLLLDDHQSLVWVIVPMVLLGLGFGLPVGLVDGHALKVVPEERTGTAAGLLNFFRIGSEAVFVAGYAALLSTLIGRQLSGDTAAATAAGQPGHPDVYYGAFSTTVVVLAALVAVVTVAVTLIRRRR